jgi:hypothetical protein
MQTSKAVAISRNVGRGVMAGLRFFASIYSQPVDQCGEEISSSIFHYNQSHPVNHAAHHKNEAQNPFTNDRGLLTSIKDHRGLNREKQ